MKKIVIIIIMLFIGISINAQMYFNISVEEGGFYTAPSIYFINDIHTDIAYIYPLSKKYALIGYYQLKYTGPDVGNSIDAKFSERNQDNYIMLKSLMKLRKDLTIKPSISFFKSYYKFAKSEEWGTGLYDLNKYEIGIEAIYKGLASIPLKGSYRFGLYHYPNYQDLMSMYISDFKDSKDIENYKGHYFMIGTDKVKLMKNFLLSGSYSLNISAYDNKKIIDANTGSEGSDFQTVYNNTISILPEYIVNSFYFSLGIDVELNHSNQNYMFGYSPDPQDITIVKNYYSYFYYGINPSISYLFRKDKILSLVFSVKGKHYSDRPAQDSDGEFTSEKLNLNTYSVGLMYSVKLSKYFTFSPMYMYVKSNSNNKYDKSISYNYESHLITMKLEYTY